MSVCMYVCLFVSFTVSLSSVLGLRSNYLLISCLHLLYLRQSNFWKSIHTISAAASFSYLSQSQSASLYVTFSALLNVSVYHSCPSAISVASCLSFHLSFRLSFHLSFFSSSCIQRKSVSTSCCIYPASSTPSINPSNFPISFVLSGSLSFSRNLIS